MVDVLAGRIKIRSQEGREGYFFKRNGKNVYKINATCWDACVNFYSSMA